MLKWMTDKEEEESQQREPCWGQTLLSLEPVNIVTCPLFLEKEPCYATLWVATPRAISSAC